MKAVTPGLRERLRQESQSGHNGFTLVELLVALSIFAVLSVMAYGGLRIVLDAREHAAELADRLARLQMVVVIIERDIQQSVARPVRDRFGDPLPPVFRGGIQDAVLELTHLGRRNPAGRPRSHLQRVAYTLHDEELQRLVWPVLDRAQNTAVHETTLLKRVKDVEIRFLDQNGSWVTYWPPEELAEDALLVMPKAIEIAIELGNWGRITRLFRVPG